MKRLLCLILLCLSISSILAQEQEQNYNEYSNENIFVWSMLKDYAPNMIVDEDGNKSGFMYELLSRIMDDLNIPNYVITGEFSDIYERLLTGEIHLFPSLLQTPDRMETIYWPENEEPITVGWGTLFVSYNTVVENIMDIENKKIGLLKGDATGETFLNYLSKFDIDVEIVEYSNFNNLVEGIKNEKVFGGIAFNSLGLNNPEIKQTPIVFSPVTSYATGSVNNPQWVLDYIDQINERLKELKNDPESYYYDLQHKYLIVSVVETKVFPTWLLITIISSTIVIVILILWSRILKSLVEKKTIQLENANKRYKALHNASFGGIAIHDDGKILECNEGLCKMFGYTYNKLIGMNGLLLIDEKYKPAVLEKIKTGFEKPYECIAVKKNGIKFHVQIEGRNIPFNDKLVRSVEFRDITKIKMNEIELKKHREHLQELVEGRTKQLKETSDQLLISEKQASLGRMVAGIAHEINTPIGVALTASSFLKDRINTTKKKYQDGTLEESEFIEAIEANKNSSDIIFANTTRAAELIQSLKEMSVDQYKSTDRIIDLQKYTNIIMTSLYPKFKGKNYTYDIDVPNLKIKIDPSMYAQFLTNLIINSIDHGFEDRNDGHMLIKITYNKETNIWTHIHEDNGIGIDDEHIDKIFEPFYTTKRGKGFTGLGCNIIYNIAKDYLHGDIKVENRKEGGAKFTLIFKPWFEIIDNEHTG